MWTVDQTMKMTTTR